MFPIFIGFGLSMHVLLQRYPDTHGAVLSTMGAHIDHVSILSFYFILLPSIPYLYGRESSTSLRKDSRVDDTNPLAHQFSTTRNGKRDVRYRAVLPTQRYQGDGTSDVAEARDGTCAAVV